MRFRCAKDMPQGDADEGRQSGGGSRSRTAIRDFLRMMGTTIKRTILFGLPLQQHRSHAETGDFAPTYYMHSDAPLYIIWAHFHISWEDTTIIVHAETESILEAGGAKRR